MMNGTFVRSAVAIALILLVDATAASAAAPGAGSGGSGSLDPTFGNGGEVITSFGWEYQSLSDVALQADGRIVAVGLGAVKGDRDTVGIVLRYRGDGTLDRTFGHRGRVVLRADHGSAALFALTIQPDGRIVTVGDDGVAGTGDVVVVRLNEDGSFDATFGQGGVARTSIGNGASAAHDVLVEPDGTIVAAGEAETGPHGESTFALVGYLPDGSLDPTFGDGGIRTTRFPGKDTATSWGVAPGPHGSVIAVGEAGEPFDNPEIAVAKYRSDGSLYRSFGTGGRVLTDIDGEAFGSDVAVEPDGRIVVGGQCLGDFIEGFALVRYLPDGALDASFGEGGIVTTSFDHCGGRECGSDGGSAVVIQPNGRIVLAGNGWAGKRRGWNFAVARYLTDGSLDRSFGNGGLVLTRDTSNGNGIALQSDGKIVVSGDAGTETSTAFAVVRYLG